VLLIRRKTPYVHEHCASVFRRSTLFRPGPGRPMAATTKTRAAFFARLFVYLCVIFYLSS
jgi:hypothetical protein